MHEFARAAVIVICSAILADLIAASVFIIAATYQDDRKRI